MADNTDNMVLYTAVYGDVDSALDDLNALEQLHEADIVGKYDAAVIDLENGKPHIVKRMDRPRIRVIPETFGSGTLPRKELKDAASELTSNEAGLIVAGEPTLEKGFDRGGHKRREGSEALLRREYRRGRQRTAGGPQRLAGHLGNITVRRPTWVIPDAAGGRTADGCADDPEAAERAVAAVGRLQPTPRRRLGTKQ